MTFARLVPIVCLASWAGLPAPAQAPPLAAETFDAAWSLVRDTYFDPAMNGLDWDAVRAELRPGIDVARGMDEVRDVVRAMLARLGQSHFTLIPGDRADGLAFEGRDPDRSADLGLDLRLLDGAVVVAAVHADGPGARAGIRPGWLVQDVDGTNLRRVLDQVPDALPSHAQGLQRWLAVADAVAGSPGSRARITLDTGAGPAARLAVARERPAGQAVTLGLLPTIVARFETEQRDAAGCVVGIVRFNSWMTPMAAPFAEAMDRLRAADGIVIDLRGNTGGVTAMVMGVAGHFLDEPISLGAMRTRAGELRFVANPQRVGSAGQPVRPYAGPLAILVDELTYSTSEIFAGGLQAIGRARVFGQRTGGGALPSLFDRLPNGDVLLHAVADFTTPGGERLEGQGVRPDEEIARSRADLLAGHDRPLDAAVGWIAAVRRGPAKDAP